MIPFLARSGDKSNEHLNTRTEKLATLLRTTKTPVLRDASFSSGKKNSWAYFRDRHDGIPRRNIFGASKNTTGKSPSSSHCVGGRQDVI